MKQKKDIKEERSNGRMERERTEGRKEGMKGGRERGRKEGKEERKNILLRK